MMAELFGLVGAVLVGYGGFLLWLRRGLSKLPAGVGSSQLDVTVVVAARNEEANLPRLLAALQDQSYPMERLEIIVIDDHSTDESYRVLTDHVNKMPNLHPLRLADTPPGWAPKKWALTTAIERSSGEIILVTDADCLPGPRWVETLVRHFEDPSTGLVMGPAPLISERRNLWWDALRLDSCSVDALAAAGAGHGLALTCTGRNLAYRRAIFQEVDGFQGVAHVASGDDDLLMLKIAATGRWKVQFALAPDAVVPSPPPPDLRAFIRQRLRYASKGLLYYELKTAPGFKLILPLLDGANLAAVVSQIAFVVTLQPYWLALLGVKLLAEGVLVYPYLRRIGQRVRMGTFLLTGLVHPWYVALIGLLGNFYTVTWKGGRYKGQRVAGRNEWGLGAVDQPAAQLLSWLRRNPRRFTSGRA